MSSITASSAPTAGVPAPNDQIPSHVRLYLLRLCLDVTIPDTLAPVPNAPLVLSLLASVHTCRGANADLKTLDSLASEDREPHGHVQHAILERSATQLSPTWNGERDSCRCLGADIGVGSMRCSEFGRALHQLRSFFHRMQDSPT